MKSIYKLFEKNGRYILVIGEHAKYGLYVFHSIIDKSWILITKNDPNYGSYISNISNEDYRELNYTSNIDSLPPIPVYPPKNLPNSINDYLQPFYHRKKYPNLYQKMMEIRTGSLTFYPIFYEDLYESLVGDGEYYYLHMIFSSEEQAENFVAGRTSKTERYFYGIVELSINEYEIDYTKILPSRLPYSYDDKQLLEKLEKQYKITQTDD